MGYSKQIAEAVREAYENKRKKAEQTLTQDRAEMYKKAPQLREIDRALIAYRFKIIWRGSRGQGGS